MVAAVEVAVDVEAHDLPASISGTCSASAPVGSTYTSERASAPVHMSHPHE